MSLQNVTNGIIIIKGDTDSMQIHHKDVSLITDNTLNATCIIDIEDASYITDNIFDDFYAVITDSDVEETIIE